jgi:tetratricopeptide (TPR) repeat protein
MSKFVMSEQGKSRFRAKDYEGAVSVFQRLISLDPGNDEAYYYSGLSYKELKRFPRRSMRSASRRPWPTRGGSTLLAGNSVRPAEDG